MSHRPLPSDGMTIASLSVQLANRANLTKALQLAQITSKYSRIRIVCSRQHKLLMTCGGLLICNVSRKVALTEYRYVSGS